MTPSGSNATARYPSISDVLALPVVRQGRPTVVAGSSRLDRRVRWVHAAEVADIAALLKGGELVLTTGIALPDDPVELAAYVDELAAAGVSGLVVELVRRWTDGLPNAIVRAAERHDLPLITLAEETRYVAVTEAVAGLISEAQVGELRTAERIHEVFTALTVAGAEPSEVLHEVAGAAGMPVVLETLGHNVIAYDTAGADPGELLDGWGDRSAAVVVSDRTAFHPESGWLVTVVGARGNDWGRLVLQCGRPPEHRHVVIIERAASALALHRLAARDQEGLERHAHRTVLTELLSTPATPADLHARAAALGVPLRGRRLIGMSVLPMAAATAEPPVTMATQHVLHHLADATALAVRHARASALVGVVDDTSVTALLALTPQADPDSVLERLASTIHQAADTVPKAPPVVLAVGTVVTEVTEARRSLQEAAHVARAALRSPRPRNFHQLDDVRLRGLLHLLADDDRVAAFVDRELGPLLARDAARGSALTDTLRHFCECGGNKSAAAAAAHVSRTAYYQQLTRIEQVLGVSLDDPESVLSLHLALLARDISAGDS